MGHNAYDGIIKGSYDRLVLWHIGFSMIFSKPHPKNKSDDAQYAT
jgi:hypothetical protein